MQKNNEKMQVFFQYAILAFQIFQQKFLYRSQIGEIQQSKKEPITFFSRGVKRNCINNCPLKTVHFEIGESRLGTQIHDLEPKLGIWKGRLKLRLKVFLLAMVFGYGKGNRAIKRNSKE